MSKNCYVCGGETGVGCYRLSKARTLVTRVKLSDRLSQILGKNFLMVLSKEDVICRCCASMLNSLDRLEKDMWVIKSILLRVLGKKYNLPEEDVMGEKVPDLLASGVVTSVPPSVFTSDGTDEWLACDKCHSEIPKKQLNSKQSVSEKDTEASNSEDEPELIPEPSVFSPGPSELDMLKDSMPAALSPIKTPEQVSPPEELQVCLQMFETDEGPGIYLMTQDGVIVSKVEQTVDGTYYINDENVLRILKFNDDDTIQLQPVNLEITPVLGSTSK